MSDELSFADIEEQQVELLPTRTPMSMLSMGNKGADGQRGQPVRQGIGVSIWSGWNVMGSGTATGGVAQGGPPGAGGSGG